VHFFAAFAVEFSGGKIEARSVGYSRPGGQAQHRVMQDVVFAADVVNIVGGNDRAVTFIGKACQFGQKLLLFRQPVVLQLDVEIAFSENIAVSDDDLFGRFAVFGEQAPGNFSGEAPAHGDQAGAVLFQQREVDFSSGSAVDQAAFCQFTEIAPALPGAGEQCQMQAISDIALSVACIGFEKHLAAENWLYAALPGIQVEFCRPGEAVVVGQCNGRHSMPDCRVDNLSDGCRAFHDAVFAVNVQMHELLWFLHSFSPVIAFY